LPFEYLDGLDTPYPYRPYLILHFNMTVFWAFGPYLKLIFFGKISFVLELQRLRGSCTALLPPSKGECYLIHQRTPLSDWVHIFECVWHFTTLIGIINQKKVNLILLRSHDFISFLRLYLPTWI